MPAYFKCFICLEWSWEVTGAFNKGVQLCLPCYVDVLEVKQARGSMGEPVVTAGKGGNTATPKEATIPGSSPSPFRQLDLFPAVVECPYCGFTSGSLKGIATHFGKVHRGTYNFTTHRVERS